MTDDREPFRTARDAGLKQRHEQRLVHAQAVIAEAAVEAVADVIGSQDLPSEYYANGADHAHAYARAALEAALPHLRAHQLPTEDLNGQSAIQLNRDAQVAEDRPKWADLFGMDPGYCDTTEAAATKALVEMATTLGYELGRKEALADAEAAVKAKLGICSRALPIIRDIGKGSA